jgi:glucokinase
MRIGFDIGGRHIAGALVDNEGNILKKKDIYTNKRWTIEEILSSVFNIYNEIKVDNLENIGAGIPGAVDSRKGKVIFSSNLPFKDINLAKLLSNKLNVKVKIENDANCAVYGEMLFGQARGYSDILQVTIGTGIGGGLVINKKIYTGHNGFAGEIGHHVIVADGELCGCGKQGCFEAYASMKSLVNYAEKNVNGVKDTELKKGRITGKEIYRLAKIGDQYAQRLMSRHIYYLAIGISNLITIIQPELVLIGGGISEEGEFLVTQLNKEIKRYIYGNHDFKLNVARLGNQAGILGAAYI